MDYVQPVGEADPNAPYRDRNTGAGVAGSRVPAKAIENPQREIVTVIERAGLTPDRARVDQLADAIELLIDLATGGGDNPLNDLLALLRARLPIYPEIVTADGRFNLTVPSTGNVRIPSGIQILHRGVFPITTAEQTFTTLANKTYHLRYRFTGTPGWSLVDTSDSGYNPGALAEGDPAFDSTVDDMISHRVVTDASNVATITALSNRERLRFRYNRAYLVYPGTGGYPPEATETIAYNLARTPEWILHGFSESELQLTPGSTTDGSETNFKVLTRTRYSASVRVMSFSHVSSTRGRPEYDASFVCLD